MTDVMDRCCERCVHWQPHGTMPDLIFGGHRVFGRCERGRGQMEGRAWCYDWKDSGRVRTLSKSVPNNARKWTPDEDETLAHSVRAGMTRKEAARLVGRTVSSVSWRAGHLGLSFVNGNTRPAVRG